MGALTIKSYYYESRPWELLKVCVPNLLTSYPNYVLLYFKNESLLKILPWNRNEFISNELRFSLDFFSNIFDFNKRKKSFKKNLLDTFILYIVTLQYISNLWITQFTNEKHYIFNLYSNFFVIHNYLNQKVFNFKLNNFKLLQSSNLKFFDFFHFAFLKNFNDCLNDCFLHIFMDRNLIFKFTDFYYHLYNTNLLLSNINNDSDDNEIIVEKLFNGYNKFSILNFAIKDYINLNIVFFYKLILKRIYKQFIMDVSLFSITLKKMLSQYFPYYISYNNTDINFCYLSCSFSSFNYINSIGFIMIEDLTNLKIQKKNN